MAHYYRAEALERSGEPALAQAALTTAASAPRGTCQISRLDDYDVLTAVASAHPEDANSQALLGNWLYHVRRPHDAQEHWKRAVSADPKDAVSWRNLGVAAHNVGHDPARAAECYRQAVALRPDDAKLAYEQDQLHARLGMPVAERLQRLAVRPDLVAERDDLTTVCADLATLNADPKTAVRLFSEREFGPWEGGEGMVLGAWERAHYLIAWQALHAGDAERAVTALRAALDPPPNLGEARHLLANGSDLWLLLGDALAAAGNLEESRHWWQRAAHFEGDFQTMSVVPYSDLSYYSVLALRRLGEDAAAERLLTGREGYIVEQESVHPEIDYFATSLPTMLLFDEDLDEAHTRKLLLLKAQAADLRGDYATASAQLDELLRLDPAQLRAALWRTTRS
jgi:tetratricopeptide (TPR) repeat protein